LFCLENAEEMPALPEELEEALTEDISINNSWGPKRIIVENGKVVGVEFIKCLSVFDENGKFKPVYDESNIKKVAADKVLLSVGQAIEWGNLIDASKIVLNANLTAKADAFTLQTNEPDIFVGGDVMTGPKFAIDAISLGKEAAISIHRYVQVGQSLTFGRARRDFHSLDKDNLNLAGYDAIPREKAGHDKTAFNKSSFKDIRNTFTAEQIAKETERCLGCGVTVVDEYLCLGCGACTTRCKLDAISLKRIHDSGGKVFEELKPVIVKALIKRKGRMIAKKIKNIFK
jgi:NAD-dependent dihydropyrimidine dehydrogenase PreA subunit